MYNVGSSSAKRLIICNFTCFSSLQNSFEDPIYEDPVYEDLVYEEPLSAEINVTTSKDVNSTDVDHMRSIFPYADEENLQKALADSFGCLEDAVDEMLEEPTFATKPCVKNSMKYSSIKDALAVQHSKFKGDKETLKVSPNEVFEDILAHFKSSTFDPLSTLRIRYDRQPAADTGGVLHQCFADAFQRFSEKWFTDTGAPHSRAPLFRSDILLSKIFMYLGRMIAYSVSQYGPGFPVFSRAVYEYICSGSISNSLPFLTIENIGDQRKYSLASQVILYFLIPCIKYICSSTLSQEFNKAQN